MEASTFSLPTFRDPAGSITIRPDSVYRSINSPFANDLLEFLNTPRYASLVSRNLIVASQVVYPVVADQNLFLRHPLIAFRSYPWEWPPSLWLSAAELTLDLCIELLVEGWILKDATPLNVLFRGASPVFVDVPSVQRMDRKCPLWFAYGQFVRTFLLPMLAHSQLGWPLQTTIVRRDGYEPEDLFKALPWSRKIKRPALTSVTLPLLFAKNTETKGATTSRIRSRIANDPEIVEEIIRKALTSLKRDMQRAMPPQRGSLWSNYVDTATHYEAEDHTNKLAFVKATLSQLHPRRVLDVGCNTGVYSNLAADLGAEVVAIDTDSNAVDRVAMNALNHGKNILPLCVDLAYPTPATGWDNRETVSFLDRCSGHFDTVLMLAVVHHLLLSSQIPLSLIASLCSRLTTKDLIIEWVPPSDVKFIEILRGRKSIYQHIDEPSFRDVFGNYFETIKEKTLRNGRILLHLRKK
ncbi:class I SAM-dependent methyltransferase [Granulicella aggregans]|uniref:class I SAM-dependent methyltransferase n=1 Tax=Granulicella aggregans TaxID=474949 RepID=UPI0021E050CB|nr:class I SAM-dependent methyltransferase [Granulicella aggregans]